MHVSLSIKDVPEALAQTLRDRARRNHRSIQGELMHILEAAVAPRQFDVDGLRRRIASLGLKTAAESVAMVREDRDSLRQLATARDSR